MTTTLCLSGSVLLYAGEYVDDSVTETQFTEAINGAEGDMSATSRYDYVVNYAKLHTTAKAFLTKLCAVIAALNIVDWNKAGYTNQRDAETKLDLLTDIKGRGLNKLKDQKYVDWLKS